MHCDTSPTRWAHPGTGRTDAEGTIDNHGVPARDVRESWFGHFSISIGRDGDADVVALRGELDIVGAAPLHDCLARLAGHDVVVDLRRLSFIDAAGMSALVIAHARARRDGRSLVVRGAHQDVRRVLGIGGLGHLLADLFDVDGAAS